MGTITVSAHRFGRIAPRGAGKENLMEKQVAGRSWHSFEEFAEMAGFHSGFETFRDKGFIKWTNTATQMHTGGVHGLSYKVEKNSAGNPEISLRHWIHWPGGKAPETSTEKQNKTPFITLKTETRQSENGTLEIRPVEAVFNGKSTKDPVEIDHFMHFLQETAKEMWRNIARNYIPQEGLDDSSIKRRTERQLNRRDDIPNLYQISRETGLNKQILLDGMYYNGEFNFGPAAVSATAPPAYPRELLYAMLGLEGSILDNNGAEKPFSKSYSMPNPAAGGYEGVTYSYAPDKNSGFRLACHAWSTNREGVKEQTEIYSVDFAPLSGDNPDILELKQLSMLPDKRFAPPDLTDHKGVARAIKAMKFVHMAILQGEMPLISDILYQHDLKSFLRQPKPPETGPENPRTLIQVFGANREAVFTERELGIGSNGALMVRDFMKDNKWVRQGIGIDWGVTFGDPENAYYHTIMPNFGRYLQHPTAKHIAPHVNTIVNLETHEHEDHLRGIAKVIKSDFIMPPMVMNQHTFSTLKDMMGEEKVSKDQKEAALAKCHVIDIRDVNAKNPQKKKKFIYGNTVIEQYAEEIWSESEQKKKHFPVLDVWTKDHPEAKTHVRIGPAGHSAHAFMFEVEGVLYTGDYKLDQTLAADLRTDADWLAKCADAAVHIQESTNATKKTSSNAGAKTIRENRKAIIQSHPGRRILADMIGSNAIDIANFCDTIGEASKGMKKADQIQYIIVAGTKLSRKYRDLNKTHDLKKQMGAKHGIQIVNMNSKTARQLLSGDKKGNYAVIMTGTQDEPLSITHRVSRGLHPSIIPNAKDIFLRLQNAIPVGNNFKKRIQQNARLREAFGATVYDAGEEGVKGKPIYDSSHASQDDYRQIHKWTTGKDGKGLLKLIHHGGPAQLDAMMKIMTEEKARAIIPDPQSVYEIDRVNKDVKLASETIEERIGYREIRDDAAEFYKKQRQQATVLRVKDTWHGQAAEAMYRLEQHAQKRFEEKHSHKPTDRGANLTEDFNDVGGVGDFPPIGIYHPTVKRPYHQNHKNINLFIGMDTETMGANPAKDLHTSSSFIAADYEGKILGSRSFHHALPSYLLATPGALCVTGNKTPKDLYRKNKSENRFDLREYAFNLFNTYRKWPQELAQDKHARAAFIGYRNSVFDDPITMRMLGMALAGVDMKPMATHGNIQFDVFNMYSVFLALHPDKVGNRKDADGNYIRTLETACKTNGVIYENGHNDLNDAKFTLDLFFKLKKIDPDLTEQMMMNADFSASRASPMVDQILGQSLHPNDQSPVFGYIDRRDRQCRPHIGGLVAVDTKVSKATDAIVIDLANADPYALEKLSDQKLLEVMNDPAGPFSVVKMNQSPMWFPPQFIYNDAKIRRKAVGRTPKTTIMQRANVLKQMRDNSHEIGKSFMQRVQDIYPKSALCRSNPEKFQKKAANDNSANPPFRIPNEKVFSMFHVAKGRIKNVYWAEAAQLLHLMQPKENEFTGKMDTRDLWTHALKTIKGISERAYAAQGRKDPYIEDIRFLIEWQADNINPAFLPKEDRVRMNALKSAWLHQSVQSFIKDLDKIEADPQMFKKLIGSDNKAQERWAEMKNTYLAYAESMRRSRRFAMTKEKQNIVNAERRNDPSWDFG